VLTKEKRKAVLSAALFGVGIMIITSGGFTSTSINTFASTSNDLFIVSSDSGAEVKTMELKAVKENGEARKVSSFAISIDNVVSVERNGRVTVFSAPTSPTFTSAKITNTNDNTVDIPITDAGVISLAGYSEGVYTLDVIVDDRFAYESIVVIGPEEGQQQIINKQITEINNEVGSSPWLGRCPPGSVRDNNQTGRCVRIVEPCPPGSVPDNQTGHCIPIPGDGGNDTTPKPNATDTTPKPNATDTTPKPNATDTGAAPPFFIAPDSNITQSDDSGGGGSGGPNETGTEPEELAVGPGPPVECGEGEQLTPDGLNCEPITSEPPLECPEGEQLAADGLNCEPIAAESRHL
jgi:hypothetical protein